MKTTFLDSSLETQYGAHLQGALLRWEMHLSHEKVNNLMTLSIPGMRGGAGSG
jgi:hypothetical protein